MNEEASRVRSMRALDPVRLFVTTLRMNSLNLNTLIPFSTRKMLRIEFIWWSYFFSDLDNILHCMPR